MDREVWAAVELATSLNDREIDTHPGYHLEFVTEVAEPGAQFVALTKGNRGGNVAARRRPAPTIDVTRERGPAAPVGGGEARDPDARATPENDNVTAAPSAPQAAADAGAHFFQIQAKLTPEERAFIGDAINRMSVTDLMAWRNRLLELPVDDAVAMIKAQISQTQSKDVAS